MPDVVLVDMPFAQLFTPSLGLSLLQAGLGAHGIGSRILYLNLRFGEQLGIGFYSAIAEGERPRLPALAGEWVFSAALFEPEAGADEDYIREVLGAEARERRRPLSAALRRGLLRARRLARPFVAACGEEVARLKPRLVGLTSVFQQHTASLALARWLKAELPDVFVVLGGANCEGVMGGETVASFPFLDAAVSGEGDLVFPDLVRRVLAGRPVDDLPGVWTGAGIARGLGTAAPVVAPMVRKMDDLPFPDYRDFATQFRASGIGRTWDASLCFESSRGCWWGEKAHCTFCGLNGATMLYRSKSSGRLLDELRSLRRAHPGQALLAVDNILDLGYFRDLLPQLGRMRPRMRLFYETKSNLRKDQLRLLRSAGIDTIQPGIESLGDGVLKLMRKGVSGLGNVQLLKWCEEVGVKPLWNLIWGFPGEPLEDYAAMRDWLPLLAHLEPPVLAAPIRLDRFSPNFDQAEALGFTDLEPFPAYRHVYALPRRSLERLAYFFTYRYREARDVDAYTRPLRGAAREWACTRPASALFHADTGEHLWVFDLRPAARRHLYCLEGLERRLYLACDGVRDLPGLARELGGTTLEEPLHALTGAGLLLRDRSRCLALSVPLGDFAPAGAALARFRRLVRTWGRRQGDVVVIARERLGAPAFLPFARSRAAAGVRRPFPCRPRPALRREQLEVDGRGDLVLRDRTGRT